MRIRWSLLLAGRIAGAWLIGLAVLWALFQSGMGGADTALWMIGLLAAASGPVVLLGVIACLAFPGWVAARPISALICTLLLAAAVGTLFGGPVGALFALSASIPGAILYLLAISIWPLASQPRLARG